MAEFLHAVREVFDGTRAIDEKKKYQVMSVLLGLVHLFFTLLFKSLHINVLCIYNICVVVFYISMAVLAGRAQKYTGIFISIFMEILFHSVMVSVLLGWEWGFMIYTMGLVPMTFYIGYTIPYLKQRVDIPAIASFIVFIVYFVVRGITSEIDPVLEGTYPADTVRFMYYFNTSLTFIFLWTTSVLFSLEIRFMKRSLEKENHSLERVANFDPLTHLLNRRSMKKFLDAAFDLAESDMGTFCLIMTDIDDFKKINDTYGHASGDAVLTHVAGILLKNVRENDCVCRWGGEEMLLLIQADKNAANAVAERICQEVASSSVQDDGKEIHVTLTLGIAEYLAGENLQAMIETADQRLYQGKKAGKNRVVAA